jgi:predicted Zn-dependent peptidase
MRILPAKTLVTPCIVIVHRQTLKPDLERGIEILSDMLQHSKYDTRELEIERDTIFRELLETHK